MARYSKIYNTLWMDGEIEELPIEGKLVYLYLLTCPIGNSAGYFKLPPRQMAIDLDLTKADALKLLETDTKLWKYDKETNQVFITNYLKYNKMGGSKQLTGLSGQVKGLEKCPLHVDFLKAAIAYASEEIVEYLDQDFLAYTKETALALNEIELLGYLKYI